MASVLVVGSINVDLYQHMPESKVGVGGARVCGWGVHSTLRDATKAPFHLCHPLFRLDMFSWGGSSHSWRRLIPTPHGHHQFSGTCLPAYPARPPARPPGLGRCMKASSRADVATIAMQWVL